MAENQSNAQASTSALASQNNAEKASTETEGKEQTQQKSIEQESETKESLNSPEIQESDKETVVTAESPKIETHKEGKVSLNSPEIQQPDKEAVVTADSPEIETEKEGKETSETMEERRNSPSPPENSSDDDSSDDDSSDDESTDNESTDDESAGLNTSASEPASPTRATDSHHTDINSMSEVSNTLADLQQLASRAHELVEKPTNGDGGEDTPNIDNRRDEAAREIPTGGKNLFEEEKVEEQSSAKSSKSMNSGNRDQSELESSKHSEVNDSISKGVVLEASKTPPSNNVPSTKPEKSVASSNNSQLKDLEDLLQFTPSSAKHSVASSTAKRSAVSSVKDDKSQGLKRLEDVLGSTPSQIQSTEIYDDKTPTEIDDDIADSGRDPNLKHLEDLMHSSTPYKNRSNSTLNDSVLNEMNDTLSTLPEPTDLMELVHASVASVTPSATKDTAAPSATKDKTVPAKDSTNDKSVPIQDSALVLPNTSRSPKTTDGPYPIPHQDQDVHSVFSDAAASAQGLSVFSDATSGQDFLRHVSDAKKKLQEIDDEMSELKGVTEPHERSIMDAINRSHTKNKNEMPALETNPNNRSIQSQVPEEKNPPKEKERRAEPPTRSKKDVSKKSSGSDEKKKRERRKTAKKKQVRPNKESPSKDATDPDGKVMPRTHYSKSRKEKNRDASQKGVKERNRDASEKIAGKIEEDRVRKNDPPMVVGGHLEADEAPIEKKKRKKKKNKKKVNREEENPNYEEPPFEEEDVGMMNMGSVVSSRRMDRGDDDGWSAPVDEVNVDYDDEIDATKSKNSQDPYDPWAEVPCSWCCRYLPHTLVVATTQAYRLDRADEKENERLSDRL